MNKTDKQIDINFGLLRWCGKNETAPERFISMRVPAAIVKDDISELWSLFGSGVTYGQAARKVAVLLDSPSEQERESGNRILDYMFRIYHMDYIRANKGNAFWETDDEAPAIDESKAEGLLFPTG